MAVATVNRINSVPDAVAQKITKWAEEFFAFITLVLVAFSRYVAGGLSGQMMAIFIIVLAAAEAAVALAIVLAIFRNFQTVHVEQVDRLRH